MKVFALLCAVAVAVSVPVTEAASTTTKACDALVCAVTPAISMAPAETLQISPKACAEGEKAYVTAIKYDGQASDLLKVATNDATGTALTNVDATGCTTSADAAEQDITAKQCGKADAKGVRVDLTCNNAVGTNCEVTYSVTFACATSAPASSDVAVACTTDDCPVTAKAIPKTAKAVFTPNPCSNTSEHAFLSKIAITGQSADKLTYVAKYNNGTAITGCADAIEGADVTAGTTAAPLTCGKGAGGDVTVEVACGATDCKVDGSVTFACAAATATPAAVTPTPSMGSMLTKANAIVGLISGMVGAVVYFNRG